MSSDSVSPSSLSLRTSRLKLGVSRPSSAASSGARTVGSRSMIASVARVHGPIADARSSRSSRSRIAATSSASGTVARSCSRGSAPAWRRPTRQTGRSALASSIRRSSTSDSAPARRASSAVIREGATLSTDVTSSRPTRVRSRVPTTTRGRSQRRNARSTSPALMAARVSGRIIMAATYPACVGCAAVRIVGGAARTLDVCRACGIPSSRAFTAPPPSPPRRGLTDQPPLVAEFALPG